MSEYSNILEQFKNLKRTDSASNSYEVIALNNSAHRLGCSQEGYPKFFVNTNESASTVQNVIREILTVEYRVPCELIDTSEGRHEGFFSIITLRSLEQNLQAYFIEIFSMMLEKMPPIPSKRELSLEVENLIEIFSALVNPPKKKIQGLWAELLVIEQSSHPEVLINAWHSSPSSKYDFTMGRDKIEVKSTSSEDRIHKFSLDQLNPTVNSRLLIASCIIRESGKAVDGLSVKDLYEKICTKVKAIRSRIQLYTIIAETIGTDIDKLENIYFDYTSAVDNLLFFDARTVPHIAKEAVPDFVTDVKFASNLTHLDDIISSGEIDNYADSTLFKSII